ncbi:TetR/AcrR family transcriptional regulator [uncultured Cohaesibacter sp.]|uniref:TetR/AcrR family transcriptional regulator n=1 Tax=uncultured Cohaesibacter sp. TaxID=1002546 RepID=UPI002930838F|nr:TetR/AcrR family transcriptional regulator [uncultured Cohaesibacter sp.]
MSEKKTRRRGDVLERAILDAAWEEALNVGFLKFTVEGVVKRAKTSRSVVYRRWNNKIELFEAAILHYFQ